MPQGNDTERADPGPLRRVGRRFAAAAGRLDGNPRLLTTAKFLRELLPGDSRFGDPLSTAGSEQAHRAGRGIARITAERPGVLREAGLSALQVWQAMAEAQGRGRGERELAIVFTDLSDFSSWALEAGDDAAIELLRDVAHCIEPAVQERGGEVVKWLGDGMMAVFADPRDALDAACEARRRVSEIEVDGYDPRLRAGIHVGRPRKVGGDYVGIDVNVAARVTEEARFDEILVSDRALAKLDGDALTTRKRRFLKLKGVPKDVAAYSVTPEA